MNYEQILPFFLDILKNMHLNAGIYRESCGSVQEFDYGICKIAFPSINYQEHMRKVCASCSPNVIYKMFDEFGMDYIILALPEQEEPACMIIGPYTLNPWSEREILERAQEFQITVERYPVFRECYDLVPLIPDSGMLFVLINSFAASLWGPGDTYSMQELSGMQYKKEDTEENASDMPSPEELSRQMHQIEERYINENRLLQAVSRGQLPSLRKQWISPTAKSTR